MSYRVIVTREGNSSWIAECPDAPGAHTWARSLPSLDGHIRNAIVSVEDLPDSAGAALDLVYEYRTGDADVDALTSLLRAERARIAAASRDLARATADAARWLAGPGGLSSRDVAALLDVSAQRISQLAPKAAA